MINTEQDEKRRLKKMKIFDPENADKQYILIFK